MPDGTTTSRLVSLDRLAEAIRPGERIYVPGSAGEPVALLDRLAADPDRTRDAEVWTSAIPGINAVRMERFHASARVTGIFMQPGLRAAQAEGRFRHLPVCYSGFVRHIRDALEVDTCIVQVSPPDGSGRCSLGPAVEFTPLVRAKSRRTLALINQRTPSLPGAPSIVLSEFDLVAEVDVPLPGYEVGPPSRTATAIAANVATLIGDGSSVQVGLGKVPDALFGLLHDRRGLRLHSGMLADSALDLAEAGALDPHFRHVSCVWVGSPGLYDRLRGRAEFDVAACDRTHDIRHIAANDRFVAVNSALSVDLFGQANLDHAEGRAVSGAGGSADFASAARFSRGGVSIVAMPASYDRDTTSRIVPRLGNGLATLSRSEVDVVVTEHGIADLRTRSVHERAEALIAVAAPSFRGELTESWKAIRAAL